MSRSVLPEYALNGGFPEPPASAPVRVVAAHHDACGASTRVRLPGVLPTGAVRRFLCNGCAAAFETGAVEEIAAAPPKPRLSMPAIAVPSLPAVSLASLPAISLPTLPSISLPSLRWPSWRAPTLDPESLSWKLLSIPIAAVFVIGALILLRSGDQQPAPLAATPAAEAGAVSTGAARDGGGRKLDGAGAKRATKASKKTQFVRESSFSLALPKGWQRIEPPAGATFAAVAADGGADATLWIKRDPKLDFPAFITQSITQMKALAGSAGIVERVPGPTADSTIVRIAAKAPAGQPTYEATLRVAGPYRYYLATSVQPGASAEVLDGVDLVTGSLTPELEG